METIVEQIHREFNEAHDKLLIQRPNASAETLYNLGFVKSKSAADFDPDFEGVKEWAEYFRNKYPQYKFISEKQVEAICRKYKLFLVEVEQYTGSVPHSKVAEISSFRLQRLDIAYRMINEFGDPFRSNVHYGNGGPGSEIMEGPSGLWICAPIEDIETRGLRKVNHNLVSHVRIDDPVVLQPVEGGFLIVAAWGPEASDENVVNEKMN